MRVLIEEFAVRWRVSRFWCQNHLRNIIRTLVVGEGLETPTASFSLT